MTKSLLHFTHGNSFPAGVYSRYLDGLRDNFDVRSTDMVGHDTAFPVSNGWPNLAAELIAKLERYPAPAILVGHSLGGILSMMVARQRPELVRCVVMLDSPVIAGWRALVLRFAKSYHWFDNLSPAATALRRRTVWPSVDAAHEHFIAKPMFAAWAPGVLSDYLEHGLVPHPDGVRLRFSNEVEAAIYRSLPDHLGEMMRAPFPTPVGFIGGTESVEMRHAGLDATRRLVGSHFKMMAGSHLFPMESPARAAQLTREMIGELLAAPQS
jgi:pimeloyl-ACP methyl ester carboxylesterase